MWVSCGSHTYTRWPRVVTDLEETRTSLRRVQYNSRLVSYHRETSSPIQSRDLLDVLHVSFDQVLICHKSLSATGNLDECSSPQQTPPGRRSCRVTFCCRCHVHFRIAYHRQPDRSINNAYYPLARNLMGDTISRPCVGFRCF